MYTIPTTRVRVLAPLLWLLGIAAVVLLSIAAVVAIALFFDALPAANAAVVPVVPAVSATQVVPGLRASAAMDAGEAGYPALCLDENGHPITHGYFETGTRDHIGHKIFL